MDASSPLMLARAQFAANMSFHILFPTISIALSWVLLFFKARFNQTGNEKWAAAYRLWIKVFALTFALGVVSGVTMSFQFGTNWPGFMLTVGNIAGPWITSAAQGYMLGWYVLGFAHGWGAVAFSALIALCVVSAYTLKGATWLVMRTDGDLQQRAMQWAQRSLWLTGLGILGISIGTPLMSARIFDRWFSLPNMLILAPIPAITIGLFFVMARSLRQLPHPQDLRSWLPFACTVGMFSLAAIGLGYSLFPYLVVDRITAAQAASATESLWIVFVGVVLVLPFIIAYNVFAYRVFRGKARPLTYY